jgi:hypothetical protein
MDLVTATSAVDTLKDSFLILSTLVVLFALIWWWGWILKNFGTF